MDQREKEEYLKYQEKNEGTLLKQAKEQSSPLFCVYIVSNIWTQRGPFSNVTSQQYLSTSLQSRTTVKVIAKVILILHEFIGYML